MRRHLTTPAVGRLNHDTGLGRKRANRAAHERSSTAGRTNLWSNLWCVWMRVARPPKSPKSRYKANEDPNKPTSEKIVGFHDATRALYQARCYRLSSRAT